MKLKWLRVNKVQAGDVTFPKGHNRITVMHVEQISDSFTRVIGRRTRDAKIVQMTVPVKRRMIVIRENAVAPSSVVEPPQQLPVQPLPGLRGGPVFMRTVPLVPVLRRHGDVRDVPRDDDGGPAVTGGLRLGTDYSADAFAPDDVPTFTRLQAVFSPAPASRAGQEAPGSVPGVPPSLDSTGGLRAPALGDDGVVHRVREALLHGHGTEVRDDRSPAGSGGTLLTADSLIAKLHSLDL